MSRGDQARGRGGRGGREGRRGGRRGGGGPTNPSIASAWDVTDDLVEIPPQDLFPPYRIPTQAPLLERETSVIDRFLQFRRFAHDGPLYSARRTRMGSGVAEFRRVYGRDQDNEMYEVRSLATIDPFTATETYDGAAVPAEPRQLPELGKMKLCKSSFPDELHSTIDPSLANSRRHVNKNPDGHVSMTGSGNARVQRALERLANGQTKAEEDDGGGEADEDGAEGDQWDEDEVYDDEDAGDYDAEHYFDDGGEDGNDGDGGGGGGGDDGETF